MEGHGGDLEPEAGDDEEHPRQGQGPVGVAQVGGDALEREGPGRPVDQAHPVEHHGGREDPDQEELHGGLVGAGIPFSEPRDQERRRRDQLQGDEQHQKVPGRRDGEHAEERRQKEEVVLTLEVAALLEVAQRQEQDDECHREEEGLEEDGEGVDDVGPAEGLALLPDEREGHAQRRRDADERDRHRPPLALPPKEQVHGQDHEDRPGQDQLRSDGDVVDVETERGHRASRREPSASRPPRW